MLAGQSVFSVCLWAEGARGVYLRLFGNESAWAVSVAVGTAVRTVAVQKNLIFLCVTVSCSHSAVEL